MGMESLVDLYDSDLLVIEAVQKRLDVSAFQVRDVEGYVREAKERFGEAGYLVDVVIMEVTGPGPLPIGSYVPHVTIIDRVTREEFDRQRMSWEVQHDILEIEETPGAIQLDGSIRTPGQSTSLFIPKK